VLDAGRFTAALTGAITDPEVLAVLRDQVGRDGAPHPLGAIDQLTDSVDVLCDPARCRALVAALAG
jgi:hypothetical protein